MEFPEREKSMKKFRTGEIRILVTTNILSRGVDIQQVLLLFFVDERAFFVRYEQPFLLVKKSKRSFFSRKFFKNLFQ